ncbi:hypothetical protein TrVE_jg14053 [Triparma verrucosa]|uniref:Uncharacterized protein n=1 Tax=Triparma verrucosa TaxID=1606542 RepID=A0A9W7C001_9STRA|nr:hypothetical protein TrVE_jg14053 [Triparma verrucosa]
MASLLRKSAQREPVSDKVAQFRGPGREVDSTAQPVIIEGNNLKVSETASFTLEEEVLRTPPDFNNKRQLGEVSIKRVQSSRVALLGKDGASILSGLGTEEEIREKINVVSLYGGAITAMLPAWWRDVSEVRQVPDHQEVWQDVSVTNGTLEGDMEGLKVEGDGDWLQKMNSGACVIFEILERQSDVSDEDAGQFFFTDLAESNGAEENEMSWKRVFKSGEILPKFRSNSKETTVCAIRGRQNVQMAKDKDFERGEATPQALKWVDVMMVIVRLESLQTDLVISYSIEGGKSGEVDGEEELPFDNTFKLVLESFTIKDFALFV